MNNVVLCDEPLLFRNRLKWDIIDWDVEQWNQLFKLDDEDDARIFVREGRHTCSDIPIWERRCKEKLMDPQHFFDLFSSSNSASSDTWLYFDYKQISTCISENSRAKLAFTWEDLGFPELSAKDSTIWIGTTGAHTPCHMDTYGCNLVAQIFGRKRWLLFPPSETENLKAVRVPYEESSVYSSYNFFRGCAKFPDVKDAILVDLEPRDVLYVPKGWWHYVENLSSAISINTWVPMKSDDESRVKEALVKYFVRSSLKDLVKSETELLLNPNEDDLTSIPVRRILEELKWCVEQLKPTSPRPTNTDDDKLFCNNYLPRTPIAEIKSKLNVPHNCDIDSNSSKSLDSSQRLNLIRAFCHPDVIDLVAKKFIESSCGSNSH